MPFIDSTGAPLDGVNLLYRPRGLEVGLFQVEQGFAWIDPRDDSRTEIPADDLTRPPGPHNSTDLASVPAFLWGLAMATRPCRRSCTTLSRTVLTKPRPPSASRCGAPRTMPSGSRCAKAA